MSTPAAALHAGADHPDLTDRRANMLGRRRESGAKAAGRLQKAGLIRYVRGHITILDRQELETASCECYQVVKTEFDRLLG